MRNALACCVKQALILTLVTNKVTSNWHLCLLQPTVSQGLCVRSHSLGQQQVYSWKSYRFSITTVSTSDPFSGKLISISLYQLVEKQSPQQSHSKPSGCWLFNQRGFWWCCASLGQTGQHLYIICFDVSSCLFCHFWVCHSLCNCASALFVLCSSVALPLLGGRRRGSWGF